MSSRSCRACSAIGRSCANGVGADPRAPCGSAAISDAMKPRPPRSAQSSAGCSTVTVRANDNRGHWASCLRTRPRRRPPDAGTEVSRGGSIASAVSLTSGHREGFWASSDAHELHSRLTINQPLRLTRFRPSP